ncbi:MAG TPA: TonB family protein [Hyphomicrobium sp.]|nr:TonB family protein [Hyphomicrobium sp.]
MQSLRAVAVTLSLVVHGSLGYALIAKPQMTVSDAFDAGTGTDSILVEQGIAIEGLAKLGDAIETIETAEVVPMVAETPPPVEEVKEIDELKDAITSEASTVEDNIVKTEEEPPPEIEEKPPITEAMPVEQPEQIAIVTEQSSGEAKSGSVDATQRTQYLGKLRDVLERSKINPRSRLAGTVWVKFKVGMNGELMSREIMTSSGSKVLDDAAVAALERAAPFPPMPNTVADEPLVVSVPFKFITR